MLEEIRSIESKIEPKVADKMADSASQPLVEEGLVPREIAEETLQSLIPFTGAVANLCCSVGERLWSGEDIAIDFNRVIDGIEILVDGVQTSRVVLNVGAHEVIDGLHRDLVVLLNELMTTMASVEPGSLERRVELLTTLLPGNLEQWVLTGIPSLIRSRDS